MYDVVIIGAGIIGTSIARELSRYQLKIALVERENDVSLGTTRANSAIVHAGYDSKPGTRKASSCVRGNSLLEDLCAELQVPFIRNGALVVAFNATEMAAIRDLYQRGLINGVPDMEILSGDQVLSLEPNLKDNVVGALYAKSAGIVGPWELAIALAENAVENGVELMLNSPVTAISKISQGHLVSMMDGSIQSRYIINCAGVNAQEINEMVNEHLFEIIPTRGEYNLFDKSAEEFVTRTIFGAPSEKGKGVVILPTVHGNLMLGPNAEAVESFEQDQTTASGLQFLKTYAGKTVQNLSFHQVITSFAGLRAKTKHRDFLVGCTKVQGFINVAGIDSPGLTSAPAIAEEVVGLLGSLEQGLVPKHDFIPKRRPHIHFMELPDYQKDALIAKNPKFGRIICRCENITEGEIVDIIHRNPGATTVDGVKRRARPGSGRCQGGFCGPRVMEILARELGKDITTIVKDRPDSYILTGPTKVTEGEKA